MVLLITTVSGNGFTYLYLVATGRMLGPEAFGILGALFAIFYIVCIIGQSLRQALATNIAEVKAKAGERAAINMFIKEGIKLSLLSLLPCVAFIAASSPVAAFFHLTSSGPVIILAFSLFTALVIEIVLGLQQGLQKFTELGLTGYTTSQGLKLLLGVIFVLIGWGLMGAMGALLASTAIATLVGLVLLRKQLFGARYQPARHSPGLRRILMPTLLLAVFLSMPSSIDVMLVTHFFAGKEAGLYNAAATIGKVVVFAPMAISFVLLPKATEEHALGQGSRKTLLRSLLYTLTLSGIVALILWILPGHIVRLFFGQDYSEAAPLISLYTAAMLLFSLDVVLVHYSLAVRKPWLMVMADLITLAEIAAIIMVHSSLSRIILILLAGNLLILLWCLPYLVFQGNRPH